MCRPDKAARSMTKARHRPPALSRRWRAAEVERLATVIGVHADLQQLRNQLVSELRESGHVSSERVAAAFRTVRRHVFVPGVEPERAYRDEPLIIKSDPHRVPISSSSQPAIMARMLEQLDVRPGHRVLEIGTGSGYNAALLAQLVGESGAVVSVDIDVDLVEDARARLAECGARHRRAARVRLPTRHRPHRDQRPGHRRRQTVLPVGFNLDIVIASAPVKFVRIPR